MKSALIDHIQRNTKITNRISIVLAITMLLISLFSVGIVYKSYIYSFFFAVGCYILLRTPFLSLLMFLGGRRTLASIFIIIGITLVILIPISVLTYFAVKEASLLTTFLATWSQDTDQITSYLEHYTWLKTLLSTFNINIEDMNSYFFSWGTGIGRNLLVYLQSLLGNIMQISFHFFVILLISFFIFRDGDSLSGILYGILPFPVHLEKQAWNRIVNILDAIIKGNLAVAVVQGVSVGLYFFCFNLPLPILFGGIATFVSLIPIVGTAIVWLPASLYLYVWGDQLIQAIVLGSLSLVTFLSLENIVKPWILDRKLNIHPLFLFLAILGGINEFGLKGVFIGPFLVAIFLVLLEILMLFIQAIYSTPNE